MKAPSKRRTVVTELELAIAEARRLGMNLTVGFLLHAKQAAVLETVEEAMKR